MNFAGIAPQPIGAYYVLMAAEMYSTNPSMFGGGIIVGTAWWASRHPDGSPAWPYAGIVAGYLLYLMALRLTANMGVPDLLRVCGIMGAASSGIAAWLLWKTRLPLSIAYIAGGAIVFLWAWIAARLEVRRDRPPAPPRTDQPSD